MVRNVKTHSFGRSAQPFGQLVHDNKLFFIVPIGYQMGDSDTECTPYSSYAVVSQLKLARGFDISQNAEAMVPISGKGKKNYTQSF